MANPLDWTHLRSFIITHTITIHSLRLHVMKSNTERKCEALDIFDVVLQGFDPVFLFLVLRQLVTTVADGVVRANALAWSETPKVELRTNLLARILRSRTGFYVGHCVVCCTLI